MKVKCDHRSKFSNLSNWKEEAWKKKSGLQTGFEPMTSAIPVRCSTNWAMKPHIGSKASSFQLLKLENLLKRSLIFLNCWFPYIYEWLQIAAKNVQWVVEIRFMKLLSSGRNFCFIFRIWELETNNENHFTKVGGGGERKRHQHTPPLLKRNCHVS